MLVAAGLVFLIGGLVMMWLGAAPLITEWTVLEQFAPGARGLSDAGYAHMMAMQANESMALLIVGATAALAGLILLMTAGVINVLPPAQKLESGGTKEEA